MNHGEGQAGQPAFKRRRIALACKSCRHRKTRCNGAKPSCSLCIELGFDCIYEQPVKGTASVTVDRAAADHDDRLRAIESTLQMLVQQDRKRNYSHGLHPYAQASQPVAAEALPGELALADDSSSPEDNDSSIDGMATIYDPEDDDVAFFGPSSNIAFIREISSATRIKLRTLASERSAASAEREHGGIHPLLSAPPTSAPLAFSTRATRDLPVDIRILPPPDHAIRLITLFFGDTGLLFPYIYEQHVLRSYQAAKERGFAAMSRPFLCLLNIIFAFATYITEHPEQGWEQNANAAQVFFSRAQTLSRGPRRASLDMVQALLLMCQYRQGTQSSNEAYLLHGLAVRLAIQMGLHSKTACGSLSPLDAEIRKRTWFACIYVDSTLAMTYGRPISIPENYTSFELPLNCNLESLDTLATEPARDDRGHVSLLIASIQLYRILNDILRRSYGANLEPDVSLTLAEMLEIIVNLESRLQSLQSSLPISLLAQPWLNDQEHSKVNARLSVIFRLRFLNVRLLLHRPVLMHRLRSIGGQASASTTSSLFQDFAKQSTMVCHEAACEVIQIVSVTAKKSPELLGAPWFSVYFVFNAALSVFACLVAEADKEPVSNKIDFHDSIAALQQSIAAIEKVGGGAKPPRRALTTLSKALRMSTALVQSRADQGAPPEGILNIPDTLPTPSRVSLQPTSILEQQTEPSKTLHESILDTWTEADWDLFSDVAAFGSEFGGFNAA